jgi:hypothetical protein
VNAKNVGKWKKNVRVRTLPGNSRKVWIFIEVLESRKVWNFKVFPEETLES